ncbi:hypothetical protein JCM8097_003953 [Rhodosporidiobolus ruineniae]
MTSTTPEIHLTKRTVLKTHPRPNLSLISSFLRFDYQPSCDGTDSNLLILFHGLGDTSKPFFQLGCSFNLPQTAVLAIQAPERVPLLEEEAWQWWDSFDALGELIRNPNPSATLHLLTKVLEHLTAPLSSSSTSSPAALSSSTATTGCGWLPSQIHLFGYQQGGTLAGELALSWARSKPSSSHLASLTAVSAPLLSHPTLLSKAATKALLVYRKPEERGVGAGSWRKGFEAVREVKLEGGRGREGMPRGMDEWREVMRFWSETLLRRTALETDGDGDVYEIAGGMEAAKAAGAKPGVQ